MSDCLLDDLVPSAKINKITLESISIGTQEYQLTCDLSIYDQVTNDKEIAKFFFSDDFAQYFTLFVLVAKNDKVKNIYDVLLRQELPDFKRTEIFYSWFFQPQMPSYDGTISINTYNRIRTLFKQLVIGVDYEVKNYKFDSLQVNLDYGYNTFDDMGNYIYDLKIPISDRLKFINSKNVENCSVFVLPKYDFASAFNNQGVGISLAQLGSLARFSYGKIEIISVLQDKAIADARVEDFRLIERIPEFMPTDVVLEHESKVQEIQKYFEWTAANSRELVNTFSPLLSTFGKDRQDGSMYLKNIFFIDMNLILSRYSKYGYLYTIMTMLDAYPSGFNINLKEQIQFGNVRIKKERTDEKSEVSYITDIVQKDYDKQGVFNLFFYDMEQITVGQYQYTLEMTIIDPIQKIVEERIVEVMLKEYSILKKLRECKEYLNNSSEYNFLRDEVSTRARQRIVQILSDNMTEESFNNFKQLFLLFTGYNFEDVCQSLSTLRQITESNGLKRNIEVLTRVIEDFLFEASKRFDLSSLTESNRTSPSSVFEISYTFPQTVDYEVQKRGMFDVIEDTVLGVNMSRAKFDLRMRNESRKFTTQNIENYINLAYMTPNKFNDYDLIEMDDELNSFFAFFNTSVNETESIANELDKALSNPQNANISSKEIKEQLSTFESFASSLGLTVESTNEIETRVVNRRKSRNTVFGIDHGKNSLSDKNADFLDIGVRKDKQYKPESNSSLIQSRSKKEELISRFLNNPKAYAILDRKDFIQGNTLNSRFKSDNFSKLANLQDYPKLIPISNIYQNSSNPSLFTSLVNRMYLNNLYDIQYLSNIRDREGNLSLVWKKATNIEQLPAGTLCRLERYRSNTLGIEDSRMVDREIMSKYFYLN